MAFLVLHDGKALTISPEKAKAIQAVKDGLVPGTAQQRAYAKLVKKIYFARNNRNKTEPAERTEMWWSRS